MGDGSRAVFVRLRGERAEPCPAGVLERDLAAAWGAGTVLDPGQLYLLDARTVMRPVQLGVPAVFDRDRRATVHYPVLDDRGRELGLWLAHPRGPVPDRRSGRSSPTDGDHSSTPNPRSSPE